MVTQKKRLFLVVVFLILLVLFSVFCINTFKKAKSIGEHRKVLKTPFEDQKIEDWMTLMFVENHYKINVDGVVGNKLTLDDKKKTIAQYCKDEDVSCSDLLVRLNNEKKAPKKNGN